MRLWSRCHSHTRASLGWRLDFQAHSYWLLAVVRRPQLLPIGLLIRRQMLSPEQKGHNQQKATVTLQPRIRRHTPSLLPYSVGQRDQLWYNVREVTQHGNARKCGSAGVILETAYHAQTRNIRIFSTLLLSLLGRVYSQTHQLYIQNCPSVLFFIVSLLLPYSPFSHHLASSL